VGVEYRHFLVVNDTAWHPQSDTAARVEAVLRQWSLADRPKQIINLAEGCNDRMEGATESIVPGPGVAFLYSGTQGLQVQRLAGPSFHEGDPAEGYTESTILVLGTDYRVHQSSEELYFELVSAPVENARPIEANRERPLKLLFDTSFPSTGATSPPVVKVHVADLARHYQAWTAYSGVWRGALVIDFGKNLPAFVEVAHALPAKDFVAQVSNAFRAPIVEIGEIY
jgi:hypothetical protein